VDPDQALEFIGQFYTETTPRHPLRQRQRQVLEEIASTGTYRHTPAELTFGARVAWRNSARCIGRLYWQGLRVRDRRQFTSAEDLATQAAEHLNEATRDGRIRATLTVFAPDAPGRRGPRIHNEQLLRYAGYRLRDGSVLGDPRNVEFTATAVALGWQPPDPPTAFDLLPLVISDGAGDPRSPAPVPPRLFEVPREAALEVLIRHPDLPWFGELGLRWHAVPAISNMPLEIGGVRYPAVPFNGWYLDTEIGARNLADTDRYDMLPLIARGLGLDVSSPRTLWRDRALVELVLAVQHSFDQSDVRMSDHHTEAERFLEHVAREAQAGRSCPTDWSWIVPPMSGALTAVFHRYYDPPDPGLRPAFLPA
jgi:nitric-oxide synthase